MEKAACYIAEGKAVLGIEFGSTRIKAVLIDQKGNVLATGSYGWENKYENGYWTYGEKDITAGLRGSYSALCRNVAAKYGVRIKKLAAIGISGMMHGYMPLDCDNNLLVPFRTWRNTVTQRESELLTDAFDFHIPQRWSIAHLYRAVLNKEEHIVKTAHITTLAVYIQLLLTGKNVIGMCEASGMFPLDGETGNYDVKKAEIFDRLCAKEGYDCNILKMLPEIVPAGKVAGYLTESGAKLLDPDGYIEAGIPFCPPEGDAATGMVATNSVRINTGNISAGTSIFVMAVLPHSLKKAHPEIDIVSTPSGSPVAMVHCNNCTGEIDNWAKVFSEFADACGARVKMSEIYDAMYNSAALPTADCDGITLYNYISGEHITEIERGVPLLFRASESAFGFANFCRSLMFSTLATIRIGMNILYDEEHIHPSKIYGHGGFFKTPVAGQKIAAAALKTPVAVLETAGEGGACGMALLALYSVTDGGKTPLEDFLDKEIYAESKCSIEEADKKLETEFEKYMADYVKGLSVEKAAENLSL